MYNTSSIPKLNAFATGNSFLVEQAKYAMKVMTLAEFETEFTRTFDVPAPSCPPYEGIYYGKPRTAVMLEVSEFYNCFGLRMSQEEGKREFPDHISAELEFLHFLTFKEAHAIGNGETSKGYQLAQKDFLERHLILWVPEFCRKLQNSAGIPFYAWLGQITSRFVTCEFELLTENRYLRD
ncbi:Putative dimethyl sulfoxide reductase chaperone [uncultured archaeon]|nr:Putative dimethyl sulfoxide reductase chaperone [uncultured archaeon]